MRDLFPQLQRATLPDVIPFPIVAYINAQIFKNYKDLILAQLGTILKGHSSSRTPSEFSKVVRPILQLY